MKIIVKLHLPIVSILSHEYIYIQGNFFFQRVLL